MPGLRHFRAWARRPVDTVAVLRVGRTERRARLLDVGLGGAGLKVDRPISVGAEVELVLQAPNRWDPLILPARVAWAEGLRAGIAFEPRQDRDAYALFEMLGAQVFDR